MTNPLPNLRHELVLDDTQVIKPLDKNYYLAKEQARTAAWALVGKPLGDKVVKEVVPTVLDAEWHLTFEDGTVGKLRMRTMLA